MRIEIVAAMCVVALITGGAIAGRVPLNRQLRDAERRIAELQQDVTDWNATCDAVADQRDQMKREWQQCVIALDARQRAPKPPPAVPTALRFRKQFDSSLVVPK